MSAARQRQRRASRLPAPRWWLAALLALMLALNTPAVGKANGGTLRVASATAGPYVVSVYTSPSPLRPGPIDVSLLVQREGSTEVVQGAEIVVMLSPLAEDGTPGTGLTFPATREQATNKLFYAAYIDLPASGRWRFEMRIDGAAGVGTVVFETDTAGDGELSRIILLAVVTPLPFVLGWLVVQARRRQQRTRG